MSNLHEVNMMTTQDVSITTGNGMMSKIFTDSATDGVWSGNVLTDSISGQSIGLIIPNATLTFAQAEYTAGLMAWRLQDAQTLNVSARGWGVKAGQNCYHSSMIPPVRVRPNDILTVFPLPVDGTANESNALAWITTTKGTELFKAENVVNNTATAMTSAVNNLTLGDAFFNSRLLSFSVQCEDGCTLDSVQIIDEMGGVVHTLQGSVRGLSPASRSNQYNIEAKGLNIGIGKGWSFKIITVSE